MIEGSMGLTWTRWKRLVSEIGRMGFTGLFRSDHFTMPDPPDIDSLEMIVSLTYLAGQSQQLHFGPLVAPFSFRDPIMLARQAMALDDLSGGRMILGVGAGWLKREHTLKRAIQHNIETPLSSKLLAGEFKSGDVIVVDANEQGPMFSKKGVMAVMPRVAAAAESWWRLANCEFRVVSRQLMGP